MSNERGEEWKEYDKAVKWMLITLFICIILSILFFIFCLPLSYIVGNGLSKSSTATVQKFLSIIWQNPDHLFTMYGKWWKQLWNHHGPFSLSLWIPVLPFITIPLGIILSAIFSPYKFQVNYQGQAKIADL
ncbi:MAG: hypothetical protein J6039_05665, partial [Alphaproteobacteria bacterium]|nr:hypothetical protein [Alphaproteobacteria bacterium]